MANLCRALLSCTFPCAPLPAFASGSSYQGSESGRFDERNEYLLALDLHAADDNQLVEATAKLGDAFCPAGGLSILQRPKQPLQNL